MDNEAPSRRYILTVAVLFEGGLAGLACLLGWGADLPIWEGLAGNAADVALGAAAALPMLALFVACVRLRWRPLERIRTFVDEVVRPLFRECTVADLAIISVLAGVGEELLFRGFLQQAFDTWLGPWPALAITSVLFGLMHSITLTYTVLATAAGAYLGWIALERGGLLSAAVAHALYDFAALVYLLRFAPAPAPPPAAPEIPPAPVVAPEVRQE